jgi:hypothetical protein
MRANAATVHGAKNLRRNPIAKAVLIKVLMAVKNPISRATMKLGKIAAQKPGRNPESHLANPPENLGRARLQISMDQTLGQSPKVRRRPKAKPIARRTKHVQQPVRRPKAKVVRRVQNGGDDPRDLRIAG